MTTEVIERLKNEKAELQRELGELYAVVFRDGGHRQATLDAIPREGHFGPKWPRRLVEGCEVIASLHHEVDDDVSKGILRKAARLTAKQA